MSKWDEAMQQEYAESESGKELAKPKPWNEPKKPDILVIFVKDILGPVVLKESEFILSDLKRRTITFPDTETTIRSAAEELSRRITDAALIKAYDAHIALGQGGIEELKKLGRFEVSPDLPIREIIDV